MHRCKKLCVAFLLTTYIEPLKSDTPTDRVKTKGPRFNRHDEGLNIESNSSTQTFIYLNN
jgi:hypothetical protein